MQLRCFIPNPQTAWFPVGLLALAGSLDPSAAQATAPELEAMDALPSLEAPEPLALEPLLPSPEVAVNTVEPGIIQQPEFAPPPAPPLPALESIEPVTAFTPEPVESSPPVEAFTPPPAVIPTTPVVPHNFAPQEQPLPVAPVINQAYLDVETTTGWATEAYSADVAAPELSAPIEQPASEVEAISIQPEESATLPSLAKSHAASISPSEIFSSPQTEDSATQASVTLQPEQAPETRDLFWQEIDSTQAINIPVIPAAQPIAAGQVQTPPFSSEPLPSAEPLNVNTGSQPSWNPTQTLSLDTAPIATPVEPTNPSTISQIPTERDLLPPDPPAPTPQPITPDLPLNLPDAEPQPEFSGAEQTFTVERFEITGEPQIFNSETLLNQVQAPLTAVESGDASELDAEEAQTTPLAAATPRQFSVSELLQVATNVANFYQKKGYSTSGAIIDIPKATEETGSGIVNIKVIEGQVETVQVEKTNFRNPTPAPEDALATGLFEINIPTITQNRLDRYVQARLKAKPDRPLNVDKLQESLQLLQLDPLIDNISAELSEGAEPGSSQLRVQYDPARRFSSQSRWDNSRSPSIGAGQRKVSLAYNNLLGVGDRLTFGYGDTKGSGSLDASYSLPINARNGSLSFAYSRSGSSVIEAPFDDIDGDGDKGDIESRSSSYELTLRQPIIRRIHNRETFEELGIGLTGSFRESQSKLLGEPFPLSPAADSEGRTKITTLRFFQDWTRQNSRQVVSLRSQVNLGLGLLGATVHDSDLGGVELPDSQFLSWQGQAQWLKVLGQDSVFTARGNAQLAANLLPSAEQFSIGGAGTVRGYRQDVLQTDNGVFASAEVQLPIARFPKLRSVVQVAPFVDVGKVWSAKRGQSPDPSTLASVGLGLQAKVGNRFTARIDYGVPLIHISGEKRTLQEKGVLFSLGYSL